MNEIFRIFYDAILSAIFVVIVFVGIIILMPVIALFMIMLMFIGLYKIIVWIFEEIKNT